MTFFLHSLIQIWGLMSANLKKTEMTNQKPMHVGTSIMLNCSFIVPVTVVMEGINKVLFSAYKEFPKNFLRIPKEFPKNSRRIPEEFPKNSRRIPKKFLNNFWRISEEFINDSLQISEKYPKNPQGMPEFFLKNTRKTSWRLTNKLSKKFQRIPREFRIHRTFEFLKNLGGLASNYKIKLKICCNILFLLYSCVQLSS